MGRHTKLPEQRTKLMKVMTREWQTTRQLAMAANVPTAHANRALKSLNEDLELIAVRRCSTQRLEWKIPDGDDPLDQTKKTVDEQVLEHLERQESADWLTIDQISLALGIKLDRRHVVVRACHRLRKSEKVSHRVQPTGLIGRISHWRAVRWADWRAVRWSGEGH